MSTWEERMAQRAHDRAALERATERAAENEDYAAAVERDREQVAELIDREYRETVIHEGLEKASAPLESFACACVGPTAGRHLRGMPCACALARIIQERAAREMGNESPR